jgi:hypothetical protein
MQTGEEKMGKIILLAMLFLLIMAPPVSAKEEGIDANIRVVDLTGDPVSNVWVGISNESIGKFLGSGVTGDDGKINLRVPGIEGPYFIQVFSYAGVDNPQSRGKELLSESRYIFESAEAETIYEIVVNEVNGSDGDTQIYKMANDSLNMARDSLEISNESLSLSIWAFLLAVLSFLSALLFPLLKAYRTKTVLKTFHNFTNGCKSYVSGVMKMQVNEKYPNVNSSDKKPDLNECPISVESWIIILNDEIKNLPRPNLEILSIIIVSMIALISFLISSLGTSVQDDLLSIFPRIWFVFGVSTVILAIYFGYQFNVTCKKIKSYNKIKSNIIFGFMIDSNEIREEWGKVKGQK